MFKYQDLIDKLSPVEIDSTIKKMVDNYDLTRDYYCKDEKKIFNVKKTINKCFHLSPEFTELMEYYIQIELAKKEDSEEFFFLSDYTYEHEYLEENIYKSLLDYLETEAKKILENREYLRIPSGHTVDFKECMLSYKYQNKVEFYKDGGWGIAENDGTVLIKNHLMVQPSKVNLHNPRLFNRNTPYRIIQDRDTKKYGILSCDVFYEVLHCLYDKIELIYEESKKHFFIKTMKNGKWGCFDDRCALIISFEYETINLSHGFLECSRSEEKLSGETFYAQGNRYVRKSDLYNNEGILLIGGYDHFEFCNDYMQFYFGTYYEYGKINFDQSECLVLDKDFKTIISDKDGCFRMSKGHVFNSLEEVKSFVPSESLLKYQVNVSDLNNGLIYLYDYNGIQYIVPKYIQEGLDAPDEIHNLIMTEMVNESIEDLYVEDAIITIQKLNDRHKIEWIDYVNEIEWVYNMFGTPNTCRYTHIYRKKQKVGFYDENGLFPALYDAITRCSIDGKLYVASYEFLKNTNDTIYNNNPNYIKDKRIYIHYYMIDEDGNCTRMEDNFDIFNPRRYDWFPTDFIEKNYGDSSDGSECLFGHYGRCSEWSEWTDEVAWDAMTDGMYGEYPGPGWNTEAFGG